MKSRIAEILSKKISLDKKQIENLIEIPPSQEMGDFAFPCFAVAKEFKKNPIEIAKNISEKIKTDEFEVKNSGAYINFFLNRTKFALDLIEKIKKEKENFGREKISKQKVMIEFSQPNTHKAFHVGHIRGTSIGESLARISEFVGDKVVRANYSGDTGMHIAKWLWCYKKYHPKEELINDEAWIASIYVDAIKRLAKDEKLQNDVDKINLELEKGKNKELINLWKETRELSIRAWDKIYRELNTHFDVHFFESEVEKRGKEISHELVEKGIAKIDEGATIIKFDDERLGVWVLLRKDGTVLYSAKDLALAEKKFNEFKIEKNIYVVGAAQSLHMNQLFKTLELMKFKNANKCRHISFAEVRLPTGKMSSRTGENILYSEFIKEITDHSKKKILKRNPELKKNELQKRALKISIAAIKYSMLKQTANKSIIFDKNDALNFEGDTGPYLLYSYARASSILRKSKIQNSNRKIKNLEPKEIELVKKISEFPEVVLNAYKNLNPSVIAGYSYQLAQIFSEFYHACPVIGNEKENFRLELVNSFRQVLKNSLALLGIETMEEM